MAVSKRRKGAGKPAMISEYELMNIMAKEAFRKNRTLKRTVTAMFNILMVSMRDEFGIGTTRMKRLKYRVDDLIRAIRDDGLDVDMLDDTLLQEIGFNAEAFMILGKEEEKEGEVKNE